MKQSTARLRKIITVLTRRKALDSLVRQQNPEQIRLAFEELGPSFIKIGQILAGRTDMFKPEFARELEKLQEQVKSDDFTVIQPLIEAAVGLPLDELFQEFEQQAFASASIAQVHKGLLKNGRQVVVKVQHPDIRENMLQDINLLEKAVSLIQYIPISSLSDPAEIVRELKRSLVQELDFTVEAAHTERFYDLNNHLPQICSPRLYPEYCTPTLMVMEFMEGASVAQYLEANGAGLELELFARDRHKIAKLIVENYIKQVFEDGFFHADPHPGNLLLRWRGGEPEVVFLDFGNMGSLDERTSQKLKLLLLALASQNADRITEALLHVCKHKGTIDQGKLQNQLAGLFLEYKSASLDEIQLPQLLTEIFQLCRAHGLILPEHITQLFKGMITLEGLLQRLAPDFAVLQIIEPYVKKYLRESFDLSAELKQYAQALLLAGKDLPQIPIGLTRLLEKANQGRFTMILEHRNLDGLMDRLERIINYLCISIVLAALILGFTVLVQAGNASLSSGIMAVGLTGLIVVLVLALVLTFRFLKRRR